MPKNTWYDQLVVELRAIVKNAAPPPEKEKAASRVVLKTPPAKRATAQAVQHEKARLDALVAQVNLLSIQKRNKAAVIEIVRMVAAGNITLDDCLYHIRP